MKAKKDGLKTYEEIMSLPKEERNKYFANHARELLDLLGEKEFQALLVGLNEEAVYLSDYSCMSYLSKEAQADSRRRDWYIIQANIERNIVKRLHGDAALPDIRHIAEDTKLDKAIITRHLKGFHEHDCFDLERQKMKMGSHSLMKYLLQLSYRHDLKAAKLYLEYCNEVYEKTERVEANLDICIESDEAILELKQLDYADSKEEKKAY